MNPETLLGLISGGRYGTSADLPTIPEMAHSYIDQIKDTYDQRQQVEMQIQGKGLGLLDMVGGVAKAGTMIPALTKEYTKSPSGQAQLKELIYRLGSMRVHFPYKTKDMAKSADEIQKQKELMQSYHEALKQYKRLGAASPGTENYIQKLLKELGQLKK